MSLAPRSVSLAMPDLLSAFEQAHSFDPLMRFTLTCLADGMPSQSDFPYSGAGWRRNARVHLLMIELDRSSQNVGTSAQLHARFVAYRSRFYARDRSGRRSPVEVDWIAFLYVLLCGGNCPCERTVRRDLANAMDRHIRHTVSPSANGQISPPVSISV